MVDKKKITEKVIKLGETGKSVWESLKAELLVHGIDVDEACDIAGGDRAKVKIVCVTPDLKESVDEMGKSPRDQDVMVRVDEETTRNLDAWVETGAVKSRSEAAALFIREGLTVRSSELEQLRDALRDVEEAKLRLREKAREVFGEQPVPEAE